MFLFTLSFEGGEGGRFDSIHPILLMKTMGKVDFLETFFCMVKYSQFSLLTGVSTELMSPRLYT